MQFSITCCRSDPVRRKPRSLATARTISFTSIEPDSFSISLAAARISSGGSKVGLTNVPVSPERSRTGGVSRCESVNQKSLSS